MSCPELDFDCWRSSCWNSRSRGSSRRRMPSWREALSLWCLGTSFWRVSAHRCFSWSLRRSRWSYPLGSSVELAAAAGFATRLSWINQRRIVLTTANGPRSMPGLLRDLASRGSSHAWACWWSASRRSTSTYLAACICSKDNESSAHEFSFYLGKRPSTYPFASEFASLRYSGRSEGLIHWTQQGASRRRRSSR